MKQLIIITFIFLVGQVKASGQTYYTEATNSDMLHQANRTGASTRVEFILPDSIEGYIPLKADFIFIHTFLTDICRRLLVSEKLGSMVLMLFQ